MAGLLAASKVSEHSAECSDVDVVKPLTLLEMFEEAKRWSVFAMKVLQ